MRIKVLLFPGVMFNCEPGLASLHTRVLNFRGYLKARLVQFWGSIENGFQGILLHERLKKEFPGVWTPPQPPAPRAPPPLPAFPNAMRKYEQYQGRKHFDRPLSQKPKTSTKMTSKKFKGKNPVGMARAVKVLDKRSKSESALQSRWDSAMQDLERRTEGDSVK